MSNATRRSKKIQASSGVAYRCLEDRRLLAGDVTVFDGDHLFIRGDAADNQIEIIGNDDGTLSIIGRDGTTINGSSDPLVITGDTNFINNENNVRASYDGGVRASFGPGNDSLLMEGVEFRANSNIYGGPGNDSVGSYQTNFSDRLLVQTFTGDDDVSFEVSNVRLDLYVITLDGEDTVGIDDSEVEGDAFVITGNNDDDVLIRQSSFLEDLLVLTQNGNDFLVLEDSLVGQTTGAYLGDGVDEASLTFENLAFVNDTRIGGQANTDRFELEAQAQFLNSIAVNTFEVDSIVDGATKQQDLIDDLIASGARLGTITELVSLTPSLSTLAGAFERTGLDFELDNVNSRTTLFAPTDAAFANLPAGTLDNLTDEALGDILRFHLTAGTVFADPLSALSEVTTLFNNQTFTVDLVGQDIVLDNEATLVSRDIRVKNGLIHWIDEVLSPSV